MKSKHEYSDVRSVCHLIKEGRADQELKKLVASDVSGLIADKDAVVIPIPSHVGFATYTLNIASLAGFNVIDCIECEPHESLYERKKRGEHVEPKDLRFRLKEDAPDLKGKKVYLFDLVYATGTTARAARALFSFPTEVVVFAKDSTAIAK